MMADIFAMLWQMGRDEAPMLGPARGTIIEISSATPGNGTAITPHARSDWDTGFLAFGYPAELHAGADSAIA